MERTMYVLGKCTQFHHQMDRMAVYLFIILSSEILWSQFPMFWWVFHKFLMQWSFWILASTNDQVNCWFPKPGCDTCLFLQYLFQKQLCEQFLFMESMVRIRNSCMFKLTFLGLKTEEVGLSIENMFACFLNKVSLHLPRWENARFSFRTWTFFLPFLNAAWEQFQCGLSSERICFLKWLAYANPSVSLNLLLSTVGVLAYTGYYMHQDNFFG